MATVKFKFPLGALLKDHVTDFEGVAIARCQYLNGCVQYDLQPQTLHEGKQLPDAWVDEGQLLLLEANALQTASPAKAKATKRTGGPQDSTPPGAGRRS